MSLLETVVFTNVMKIIPANHNGPLHLHFLDNSSENAPSDRHIASEGAFFVDVCAFNSLNRKLLLEIQLAVEHMRNIH